MFSSRMSFGFDHALFFILNQPELTISSHLTSAAFKIQAHLMYYDESLHTATSVQKAIQSAFHETARKMWAYVRCLPVAVQPSSRLIICKTTR
jgi:hypothetical protein